MEGVDRINGMDDEDFSTCKKCMGEDGYKYECKDCSKLYTTRITNRCYDCVNDWKKSSNKYTNCDGCHNWCDCENSYVKSNETWIVCGECHLEWAVDTIATYYLRLKAGK